MSITVTNTAIQPVTSLINLNFSTSNYQQVSFPLNLGSLITQSGTLTGNDPNNDGLIKRGETINHDNTNIPLLDPIPDLTNATVLGVGYMGGFISGLAVRYPIILVQSGSSQYLIYPEGAPDILTSVTGTVNTTLHFYSNAGWSPDTGIPCFTSGTRIRTPTGDKLIEDIVVGDIVETYDNGPQPVVWVHCRTIEASELNIHTKLRPIRIEVGAMGIDTPSRTLLVSQQHRMMVKSRIAKNICDMSELLIPAKHLCDLRGISLDFSVNSITYYHLSFTEHQIIYANDAPSESFYIGPQTPKIIGKDAYEELVSIFPDIKFDRDPFTPARPFSDKKFSKKLVHRHLKNNLAVFL